VAPPNIDGTVQGDEWRGAAAVTGVGSHMAAGFTSTVVPEMQQVVWYLAYDRECLYLAMHSPHAVGTLPRCRVKENDESYRILFEDHVEIQICKYGRTQAAAAGRGFYKIMVNPRGYYADEWYYNGTPGSEKEWSCGGNVRCTVEKTHWDLELAVPLKNLDVESLDGRTWVIQLVRTDSCAGIYFAGWVPASWMDWHKFAAVTFDPTAPAFQFLRTGEIRKGQIDSLVRLGGAAAKGQEIDVSVAMRHGEKELFAQSRRTKVPPGQTKELRWQARGLAVGEKDNVYDIAAAIRPVEPDAEPTTLYRAQLPVIPLTDAYHKQYLEPWLKGRPTAGDWEFRFAYSPYANVIDASVDVDFLGIPEKFLKASRFALTVNDDAAKKVLSAEAPMQKLQGRVVADAPELREGKYRATATLFAADDKTVLGEKQADFVRKRFPWEHNTIGISDRVIPPYTPLVTKGDRIKPWGREYVLDKTGLPAQVNVQLRYSRQSLLSAPIRLTAKVGGKEVNVGSPRMKITSAKGHRVDVETTGTLAGAPLKIEAFMEYDGWYQVKVSLLPKRPLTFDGLDLVCDLWRGADTIYAQRSEGRSGSKFGRVPDGEGVVWHSGQLPRFGRGWGSFVPIVFLGTGEWGLWWIAETNAGWATDENTPCVQVERTKKSVAMRFRIFGRRETVDAPRTIEFAILASPVKPLPSNWRAFAWGHPTPHYAHDTCGYRYYGDSVDAYALHTDEDHRQLRDWLLNPRSVNPAYGWWESRAAMVRAGKPVVLYGSTTMTGLGMEEFDTFAGEWLGSNAFKPHPDNSFKNKTNYGGTVKWDTPRRLTPTGVNFCQSQVDCFVWYHKNLVQKCGINGTWWDNRSHGLVFEYEPGRGRVYKWNVFNRRQLTKRLATMCWDCGRPPLWLMNMHVDFSWCQVAWHIENDFYPHGIGLDLLDMLTVDEFRAMTRMKGGIIPQLHSTVWSGTESPFDVQRIVRAGLGLCLLHDIGERGYPTYVPFINAQRSRMLKAMDKHASFFSQNCMFIPYWRQRFVSFDTPNVYAPIYFGRGTQRAVIVLLNANDDDVVVKGFRLSPQTPFGRKTFTRLLDAETELPVGKVYDREKRQYVWGEMKPYQIMLRRHDYRLVVVE